jgi:ribonuclease Z
VQAAETARDAGARHLILTHISNRYTSTDDMLAHAREVFPDTYVAADMDRYEVTHSEFRQV